MLLLAQLAYTRPFISSGGALYVRDGKIYGNFIHTVLILAVAARSAPPSPSRDNKSSLHIHMSLHLPLGPQLDRSVSWIALTLILRPALAGIPVINHQTGILSIKQWAQSPLLLYAVIMLIITIWLFYYIHICVASLQNSPLVGRNESGIIPD